MTLCHYCRSDRRYNNEPCGSCGLTPIQAERENHRFTEAHPGARRPSHFDIASMRFRAERDGQVQKESRPMNGRENRPVSPSSERPGTRPMTATEVKLDTLIAGEQKRRPTMTFAEATAAMFRAHPELYEQYRRESYATRR